jgi:hypothetical protein
LVFISQTIKNKVDSCELENDDDVDAKGPSSKKERSKGTGRNRKGGYSWQSPAKKDIASLALVAEDN